MFRVFTKMSGLKAGVHGSVCHGQLNVVCVGGWCEDGVMGGGHRVQGGMFSWFLDER